MKSKVTSVRNFTQFPVEMFSSMNKFNDADVQYLCNALSRVEGDAVRSSMMMAAFLNVNGYGSNASLLWDTALRFEEELSEYEPLRVQLERAALVM